MYRYCNMIGSFSVHALAWGFIPRCILVWCITWFICNQFFFFSKRSFFSGFIYLLKFCNVCSNFDAKCVRWHYRLFHPNYQNFVSHGVSLWLTAASAIFGCLEFVRIQVSILLEGILLWFWSLSLFIRYLFTTSTLVAMQAARLAENHINYRRLIRFVALQSMLHATCLLILWLAHTRDLYQWARSNSWRL